MHNSVTATTLFFFCRWIFCPFKDFILTNVCIFIPEFGVKFFPIVAQDTHLRLWYVGLAICGDLISWLLPGLFFWKLFFKNFWFCQRCWTYLFSGWACNILRLAYLASLAFLNCASVKGSKTISNSLKYIFFLEHFSRGIPNRLHNVFLVFTSVGFSC